jgi:rod shape determining protein RodA
VAVALGLAKYLSTAHKESSSSDKLLRATAFFALPALLIVMQGDAGSAMVYFSLIIVLFREGLSPLILIVGIGLVLVFILTLLINQIGLIIGVIIVGLLLLGLIGRSAKSIAIIAVGTLLTIGMIKSVDFLLSDVLKPHQQKRVLSLINPNADPLGVGWNVTQSKIAIGSGGFNGKGYLNGTQTKFDFVPEQTTDFIFCTIGEEQGWLGSTLVLIGFAVLLVRIVTISERQKSNFVRIYGYGVVSILFFHFIINIAMTIGLFPVIGIPLPFFSYGGSSLWTFTILLFVLIKLDAHRMQVLQH